jgi:antitoxin StbD
MGTLAAGEGEPVAILNRNEPAFYGVPAGVYAALMESADLPTGGASPRRP